MAQQRFPTWFSTHKPRQLASESVRSSDVDPSLDARDLAGDIADETRRASDRMVLELPSWVWFLGRAGTCQNEWYEHGSIHGRSNLCMHSSAQRKPKKHHIPGVLLLCDAVPSDSPARSPVRKCVHQKGFHRFPALTGVVQKVTPVIKETCIQ